MILSKLTKDQILAACDLKTQSVSIPDAGGEILVRAMSGYDRDQYLELVRDRSNEGTSYFNAALIVTTAVDDQGNKLFTEGDIPALRQLSSTTLNAIANVAVEMNAYLFKPPVQQAEQIANV